MKLIVTQAQTNAELEEAYQLVRRVYAREFNVDLDQLKEKATVSFTPTVLLIRDERQELVGTATILYPTDTLLFPSEYLFGADIRQHAQELPLRNMVEVGRLTKAEVDDQGLVVKATMLAVEAYLQREKLAGWIATVKPRMKRMLGITKLAMQDFTQSQHETDFDSTPELLDGYKGKDISTFWTSTGSTRAAFRDLHYLLEQGLIQINLRKTPKQKRIRHSNFRGLTAHQRFLNFRP